MKTELKLTDNYNQITSLEVSYDKNDKDSIYIVDLVGYLLGIEEAKEHLFEFFKRQESIAREREAKIPEMLEIIDKYFRD